MIMEVYQAIQERREITKYLNKPIPSEVMEKVVNAGFYAPSGNNLPSKRLIVVQNRTSLDQLAETTPYMKWLKEAQAAIAIVGIPAESKYWLQDGSIAAAFIWLQAVEEKLGAAFGAVYHAEDEKESIQRENHVRNILNLSEGDRVIAVLGLGYPAEVPEAKKHLPREDIVYDEKYHKE